ncbi:hypothetical protein C1H46_042896 [Malus baccata]|uniref:Uncharacterized protein n=2 Tax=Malus TaxID=3749 RepID=A0A540KCB6_MALBA|nr:hypothetical protein C1H46_042896 [Malus baccata]
MPTEYHLYSTVIEPISTVEPKEVDSERTLVLEKEQLQNKKRMCTTYQEQLRNKKFSF